MTRIRNPLLDLSDRTELRIVKIRLIPKAIFFPFFLEILNLCFGEMENLSHRKAKLLRMKIYNKLVPIFTHCMIVILMFYRLDNIWKNIQERKYV